jgi:hypothetical protein
MNEKHTWSGKYSDNTHDPDSREPTFASNTYVATMSLTRGARLQYSKACPGCLRIPVRSGGSRRLRLKRGHLSAPGFAGDHNCTGAVMQPPSAAQVSRYSFTRYCTLYLR